MLRSEVPISARQERLQHLMSDDAGPHGVFAELFERVKKREEQKLEADDNIGKLMSVQNAYAYVRACEQSLLVMLMQRKTLPHILATVKDVSEAQVRAFARAYHITIDEKGRVTAPASQAILDDIKDLERIKQEMAEQRTQFQNRLQRHKTTIEQAPQELTQLFRDLEVMALLECPDEEY